VATHRVCAAEELPPGERKIVRVGNASIGVFNVDGDYYAMRNVCPHHAAELCLGVVTGTMLPSEPGEYHFDSEHTVIRCPRHRWEFSLETGRSFTDPARYRVKVYDVAIVDGDVLLEV
jgi:nitrite reductase (NADH) small subunit